MARDPVEHLQKRPHIAPPVRQHPHIGAGEPCPDRDGKVLGTSLHERDDDVHVTWHQLQAGGQLVPQLGVVDVHDRQHARRLAAL